MTRREDESILDGFRRGDVVEKGLKLTDDDVVQLIDVLDFTRNMTKMMLDVEETKSSPGAVEKVNGYLDKTSALLVKIYAAFELFNRPADGEIN